MSWNGSGERPGRTPELYRRTRVASRFLGRVVERGSPDRAPGPTVMGAGRLTPPWDRAQISRPSADLAVREDSEYGDLTIVRAGGGTSQQELVTPVRRCEQLHDYERLLERIVELRRSGLAARRI